MSNAGFELTKYLRMWLGSLSWPLHFLLLAVDACASMLNFFFLRSLGFGLGVFVCLVDIIKYYNELTRWLWIKTLATKSKFSPWDSHRGRKEPAVHPQARWHMGGGGHMHRAHTCTEHTHAPSFKVRSLSASSKFIRLHRCHRGNCRMFPFPYSWLF